MKTNFTSIRSFICIVLILISANLLKGQCVTPTLSFANPVLTSGIAGQEDATYKFAAVAPGIDAFVTIDKLYGGATLDAIDKTDAGYSAAWQPVVHTPSGVPVGSSYIKWRIEFKNSDNSNHQFNCLTLSAIDVDGNGTNVKEFVESKSYSNYNVMPNTLLILANGGDSTKATGPLTTMPDIDTSAWNTNINFNFQNKWRVEVKTGNTIVDNNGYSGEGRFSCIFFKQITMGAVLPVKYTSFDASASGNTVNLKWVTENETNNHHFEVERSFDGTNFTTIGYVMDAEITNGASRSYRFKDNTAELQGKTVAYYRLKQVDNNARFTYSIVLPVRLQVKSTVTVQASPNPFINNVVVRFESTVNGAAELKISNFAGQSVVAKQSLVSKGYNNIQLDNLTSLAAGMYTVQVYMNGTLLGSQKLIKN